jgi:hypothetical protein
MALQEYQDSLLSWEGARGFLGLSKAFLPICGTILFRPVEFFRQFVSPSSGSTTTRVKTAVVFAILLGYTKLFFEMLNMVWLKVFFKNPAGADFSTLHLFFLNSPLMILRPLVSFVVTLGLLFLGIKFVLGFDKKMLPVFLVVCYQSASDLFLLIPIVGGLLSIVWSLALILIGIREVYGVNLGRSLLAAIVIPGIFLFSVVLAIGPSVSRWVISLYPEARTQMVKFNDLSAYASTSAIVSAAENYKRDLGFYPVHLGVLDKYLSSDVMADVTRASSGSGYSYRYERPDDQHFSVYVQPQADIVTGRLKFYADNTGKIRFDGPEGLQIKSLEEVEKKIFEKP